MLRTRSGFADIPAAGGAPVRAGSAPAWAESSRVAEAPVVAVPVVALGDGLAEAFWATTAAADGVEAAGVVTAEDAAELLEVLDPAAGAATAGAGARSAEGDPCSLAEGATRSVSSVPRRTRTAARRAANTASSRVTTSGRRRIGDRGTGVSFRESR